MGFDDLTDTDKRLYEYIKDNDFESKKWNSEEAAEQLGVETEAVYRSLSNLSKHIRDSIYIHYKDGGIRVSAE